ncbi:hypothetical protein O3M35_013201 [Rhynocoris fuscipes]|uniref:Uncharacterized protein n=1 Tax=Rhynocoris fuscipes TaxID=488301 RepID=A0AAW1CEK9_9HEMI
MFTILEYLGIIAVIIIIYKLVKSIISLLYLFLAPCFKLNVDLTKMGKWAVVTGATDGLGKAFAYKLASLGINVVLISRSKSKLEAVAAEIEEKYKVSTKVIEADFTEKDKIVSSIENEISDLEIGVLINNVGLSYPHPEYFLETEKAEQLYSDIIQVNVASMLTMCQIVMPAMVERKKGVVINISSATADIPSPLLSVYGASKIFVSKFTRDLGSEYKKKGVIVQCLIPGYVATKMSKIKRPTWMTPSPSKYVSSAIKTIGIESHTTGYLPHTLHVAAIKLMENLSPRFAEWVIVRTMLNVRKRALKRQPQTLAS